jgi:CDP-paratose 2-epimerase
MREAITLCEKVSGKKLSWTYVEDNRIGDHIWYVSDVNKFKNHFPSWSYRYDLQAIIEAIYQGWRERSGGSKGS